MKSKLLDRIPRAKRYELKDVETCGQAWRDEMEEVHEDIPDFGDLWVTAEDHESLRKDMAIAVDVGNTAIDLLQTERAMLMPFLNYVAILRNTKGEEHLGKQICEALTKWETRNDD